MNFALELFLISLGMIYLIVIIAELLSRIPKFFGEKTDGSD